MRVQNGYRFVLQLELLRVYKYILTAIHLSWVKDEARKTEYECF